MVSSSSSLLSLLPLLSVASSTSLSFTPSACAGLPRLAALLAGGAAPLRPALVAAAVGLAALRAGALLGAFVFGAAAAWVCLRSRGADRVRSEGLGANIVPPPPPPLSSKSKSDRPVRAFAAFALLPLRGGAFGVAAALLGPLAACPLAAGVVAPPGLFCSFLFRTHGAQYQLPGGILVRIGLRQ